MQPECATKDGRGRHRHEDLFADANTGWSIEHELGPTHVRRQREPSAPAPRARFLPDELNGEAAVCVRGQHPAPCNHAVSHQMSVRLRGRLAKPSPAHSARKERAIDSTVCRGTSPTAVT